MLTLRRDSEARAWRRRGATLLKAAAACAFLALLHRLDGADDSAQQAYIGPGAGIALLGSFLVVLSALISAVFFALTWPIRFIWRALRGRRAYANAHVKRVVVLGLDGLEPTLTERFMDEGRLPNLAKLRDAGSYLHLGTTYPPLSPVAWSSFSTGANPGKHNIFDFISRNPTTYRPTQSSVSIRPGGRSLRLGRYVIPLSRPRITGLRRSKPFWTVLGEAGVFSAVLRVPITYPPDRFHGVQLSAMCVPDLRGTHGIFSYFTESGTDGSTTDGEVGGDVIQVERNGDTVRSFLRGPDNTLRADHPELRIPFKVTRSRNGSVVLSVNGQKIPLTPGRFTDWVRVTFRPVPGLVKVRGVCRFHLKQFDRPFAMYCTPVQIDPDKPVMPISHPRVYSTYLARLQGTFSTLGLAEDTWSLSEKRMTEDAFLTQAYGIHAEREQMFFDSLRRIRRGLVVCVFDGPDRIQHMFWRFIDDDHPALRNGDRAAHEHVIREMYEKMDDLVGRTVAAIDDDTALFVMSDHGFKPFRRGVDLNALLREHGYLALRDGAEVPSGAYLADIDWSKTKAYALGLAGIYINERGREGHGIVSPGKEKDELLRELCDLLTGLRDDESNEVAIHEAVPRDRAYHGPYVDAAPDIIVGYRSGYRVSWDAVIGKCGPSVFSDNTKAWSGDHCIHPELVPGVLFSSEKLNGRGANIIDVAPTALELLGVGKPKYMDGKSLRCVEERS
ncbi:MAG: alkaline phosphatase family protein [Phycisphaerales bacterium]|nr:alkaline phosphatase family protein [Phycisphaerales bacterium]